jgi:hypothetical protein
LLDLQTRQLQPIMLGKAGFATFSPDGKTVMYIASDKISFKKL